MNPHFIAHEPSDTVGVVVVEKVKAGQEVTGWIMETDKTEKLSPCGNSSGPQACA